MERQNKRRERSLKLGKFKVCNLNKILSVALTLISKVKVKVKVSGLLGKLAGIYREILPRSYVQPHYAILQVGTDLCSSWPQADIP